MYRLNGLLIADQIRAAVSAEMRLGRAVLPPLVPTNDENGVAEEEVWPPLNFGWTLADVVSNTSRGGNTAPPNKDVKSGGKAVPSDGQDEESGEEEEDGDDGWKSWGEKEDMGRLATRLMNKLAREERINKKKKLGRRLPTQ